MIGEHEKSGQKLFLAENIISPTPPHFQKLVYTHDSNLLSRSVTTGVRSGMAARSDIPLPEISFASQEEYESSWTPSPSCTAVAKEWEEEKNS